MKIVENMTQGTDEWRAWRAKHITATNASIIMNENPFKTSYKLWSEKMGLIAEDEMNDAMRRGVELEPIAREKFEELTGEKFPAAIVKHDYIDYMAASLDGLSLDSTRALEIKCPRGADYECAMDGKIPEKYYGQLQHQMACLGHSSIYYFTFNPPEFKILVCERDDKYIKRLLEAEADFWKCLQNLEPPEMTNKDFVKRDDLEWKQKALNYQLCKASIEANTKILERLKSELVLLAGSYATKGGGLACSKRLRRGSIDYSSIPELKQVDLEKYRKPAIEYWRICNE